MVVSWVRSCDGAIVRVLLLVTCLDGAEVHVEAGKESILGLSLSFHVAVRSLRAVSGAVCWEIAE